ncbi:RluA family pseudouridine synthase [Prolixibacteraceae bacterium Z1-6]|uniref:Pseudouridine synthase n=1 Tax=Draconibacterium aestuarii TaxID=2998507 RepID=A0A9X3J7C6_9BACT|nr:RluA family pseudouridine synthase [Prolixibacteraceae bacterium Z1-6]
MNRKGTGAVKGKEKNPSENKKGASFQVKENTFLMEFLMAQMPGKSRSKIKLLLGRKQVLVDGKPISQFNHALTPGQKVEISKGMQETYRAVKQARELSIVYEDAELIVIEKPAGLLSIGTEKEKRATAYSLLSDYVKQQDPENKIFVVHRLDRETSGLMMFAKSEEIKYHLQELWVNTVIERTYIAVVEGYVKEDEGVISSYLVEGKTFVVHSSQNPKAGKKAVTNFKTLQRKRGYSLLKVNLDTGRKNQIRVHMQDIGHSIIGDKKYGATVSPIKRLGLHAQQLSFAHPLSGKKIFFESKIPEEFLRLFK